MNPYPRPHFDRSHAWSSLNGDWDFRADTDSGWSRITVPYAWETAASGVGRHWLPVAWYRRRVRVPGEWAGLRVILHFGAVNHEAVVWVNGVETGGHVGGYTPFEMDVTDALTGGDGHQGRDEHEIVVRVGAPLDKRDLAHGKQRSVPRDDFDGVCFTPSSGIWQSVWLEARPEAHISRLALRPNAGLDGILVEAAATGGSLRLTLRGGEPVTVPVVGGHARAELPVPSPRRWSPEDPHLYVVDAELDSGDRVSAYTGLRRIEVVGEELYLNGERLFVRGVLDQGYWPLTGITPPSDEAMVRDIELAAAAGYNLVRKHLKLEDPRFHHHADRMGMLVWAEPAATGRFSDASVEAFEAQIAPMVERDGNAPSIVVWGLYNEEWGLDWDIPGDPRKQQAVARAYDLLKALDDSRPAVDNSGWAHVRTDLLDWHYYDESASAWARNVAGLIDGDRDDFPVRLGPDFVVHKALAGTAEQPLRGLPNLNSEYGAGFTSVERAWHLRWQTQELRRHDRLAGYVYTELYDIEHESAGLLDTERRPKDLAGIDPADVNAVTTLVVDVVPVAPGRDLLTASRDVTVGVRVSHHGTGPVHGHLRTAWTATFGATPADAPAGIPDGWTRAGTAGAKPFALGSPCDVHAELPEGWGSGRLHIALVADGADGAGGAVLARTAVDVDTCTAPVIGDDRPF
ncbi:glycoside hydrolase family 2 protein [Streptosporangium longisporum]|uniref:Glycoside hydrolase family 2 n=1 Tax=Streptosporangium longisporum TaxID=46187 RepID=A0ABN3XYE9_9ACTN